MNASELGAMPASYVPDVIDHDRKFYSYGGTGLTKREAFAMAAMQGALASNPPAIGIGGRVEFKRLIASASVEIADSLLAELAKGSAP